MSARTMIDGLEFAGADKELRGSLAPFDLTRLQDCLFDAGSAIDYRLRGGRDQQGRPALRLEITGLLHLQCQRCLGLLEYPLRMMNTLLLVRENERCPRKRTSRTHPTASWQEQKWT